VQFGECIQSGGAVYQCVGDLHNERVLPSVQELFGGKILFPHPVYSDGEAIDTGSPDNADNSEGKFQPHIFHAAVQSISLAVFPDFGNTTDQVKR
jgi:hypothetical protein